MSRLADYFVIVGYDHEKERSGSRGGKILQRFPEKDWPDTPFIDGIEWFCQPLGWKLSTDRQEPQFFTSVLTDIDARHHYCACLSFNETVAITPSKPVDDEEEDISDRSSLIASGPAAITHHSVMYAPKCLVIVSKLNYLEVFKNCLGTIYTVYIESLPYHLESLIGNILGYIQIPPPGGRQVRFSIGAGDKQVLQPPLSQTLPVTGTCVYQLFQQLGIKNVLLLFCAVLTEHKILLHSSSFSRLTDSCHALTALMYPFRFSHVYIPILPASLTEVLSSPTPFIMGVHSDLQNDVNDVMDVIVADLDGGSIYVPESLVPPVSRLPSTLWRLTQDALQKVLQPELGLADMAFPVTPSPKDIKPPAVLDKEIRAIFMRLFAQILQGYRSCLTLIRIYPKPVIKFHKAGFLGARDLIDCDFLSRLLDSMFFSEFVSERGPPWRCCDAWDELYSSMNELLKTEAADPKLVMVHIYEIAMQLYANENPNPQVYPQKILRPPDGAFARIHQPQFPVIDGDVVQQIIDEGMSRNNNTTNMQSLTKMTPRIVPMGCHLQSISDGRPVVNNTARRLEVLKTCVRCIFENKIADARKSFPAVMRILKQRDARLTLCRELACNVQGNKAVLDNQQFDLVVKLMNRALQDDSSMDEYGVAAALLPLSTAFCRKLCTGVIQFAYSCIQDHPVWRNQAFWEMAFYQDVQSEIKSFYMDRNEEQNHHRNNYSWAGETIHAVNHQLREKKDYRGSLISRLHEPLALEIAAEQMCKWPTLDEAKRRELIDSEEKTVFSQATHYANRMVSLLLPLDININQRNNRVQRPTISIDDTASISNSVIESRSQSCHSDEGFDEQSDPNEVGNQVIKTVYKFIDRICTEGNVTEDHIKSLHNIVPGLVHMQVDCNLEVNRESKRIPPIQKPKIQRPILLSGEEFIGEPIRSYLLTDGREETVESPLFPAEGALFLTNYRVIFRGSPCDALACEHSIVRAFPISSLTKEKRLSVLYLKHLEQVLPEGLQLRSCTFQLIKVAFDEEVTVESIEAFRKQISRVRHPMDEFGYFAFASHGIVIQMPFSKDVKEKNATLRNIAKRTLMRTAKKAGFKSKPKSQKFVLADIDYDENADNGQDDDDNSDDNADTFPRHVTVKDVDRLKDRSYVKDWLRLGLGDPQSGYRMTTANCNYSQCPSYPAMIVCPKEINDESLRNLAKCYKNQRFPVPTWRHQNGAVLVRSAVPLAKGVMGMLKGHPSSSSSTVDGPSFQEQDRYFVQVIRTTPHTRSLRHTWGLSDSNVSIDSLAMAASMRTPGTPGSAVTPDSNRRSAVGLYAVSSNSSFSAFRSSQKTSKWNSLKPSPAPLRDVNNWDTQSYTFQRVPLYFLGEKSQSKSARLSEMCAEFIPLDYTDVRHSRLAFKKLMGACLPSVVNTEPDKSFAKLVEQSEWLQQIRGLLQLSGAVVDLIDLQESSVCLSLEDGWDVTCQLSALAQLCLDPYYRTIEGFRVLIEKEWLAFGHRFGHRSNLKPASSRSGSPFAPTFLQFLDAVYQIHLQFPLAFEFNEYYLRFLAYHSVSCRFRTFLFDCERERACLGITAVEDKRGSLNSRHKNVVDSYTGSDDDSIYPGGARSSNNNAQKIGLSVFDYIERQHTKSPIFFNFMYTPDPDRQVLRPQSSLSVLEIWPFYTNEELAQGPPYDPELIGQDIFDDDDSEYSLERGIILRKVVMAGYDNLERFNADAFSTMMENLKQSEAERNLLPQKWRQVWDKLELPHSDSLTRHASFSSALVRSQTRLQHKRSTLEIIMRGRLSGAHQETFSHPHRFEKHAFTTPTHCNHCGSLLWGPVKNGLRCMDCGNSYHEKCADSVPKNCTKYKAVEGPPQTLTRNQADTSSISSSVNTTGQTSNQDIYNKFGSDVAENKTHEGYLYKRGALLKGWKQRWFVLDSIKHQIRYFDSMEDSNPKGFIDLAEVQSVIPAQPSGPLPSKNADEHAFFDLKTNKRTYYFYGLDEQKAREWIDKIQACLQ